MKRSNQSGKLHDPNGWRMNGREKEWESESETECGTWKRTKCTNIISGLFPQEIRPSKRFSFPCGMELWSKIRAFTKNTYSIRWNMHIKLQVNITCTKLIVDCIQHSCCVFFPSSPSALMCANVSNCEQWNTFHPFRCQKTIEIVMREKESARERERELEKTC